MKTINDISCKGKKVLVRVDFNVPVNEQFEITDTTRIEAAKPTIMKIVRDGGSAILLSTLDALRVRMISILSLTW